MSETHSASFTNLLVIILIVFICACACLALEIATNFVPSVLLYPRSEYPSQGDKLTFWGRTYCSTSVYGYSCYTVDAVEPKILIPVLTALCATALEVILLFVLCVLKCCFYCRAADASTEPYQDFALSSTSSNNSFGEMDKAEKEEANPLGNEVQAKPATVEEPSHTKLFCTFWVLILLLVATQVVALALGIAFYEMEHKKYLDIWRGYGIGFIFECVSLGISAIAFLLILQYIILARITAVRCVSF